MRKLSTSLRELQTSDSISPELFNEVAQLGHFAGGLAVIWGSIVLFGSASVWWAFGTLAVVAGIKEFWWDQHHESAVVRGSNFEDWSFYMLGRDCCNCINSTGEILLPNGSVSVCVPYPPFFADKFDNQAPSGQPRRADVGRGDA